MSVLFPDRERRHLLQFHVIPSIGYVTRFLIAAALILAGLAMQAIFLHSASGMLLVGSLVAFAGNLLLLIKGYDLRRTDPDILAGIGDWERTSLARLHEVSLLEDEISGWDETFADITSWTGALFLCFLIVMPVGIVWVWLMARWGGESIGNLFLLDAVILIAPHWLTGLRRKWRPVAIRETVDSLAVALAALQDYEKPPSQIQPLFLMAGEGKARVPVDARAFVRFPDGPEDFLGMQIQVSVNAVQGTNYPYLYAVLVAKKGFGLRSKKNLKLIREAAWNLTVEKSSEKDVDVVVIRQHTTSTSGYHTGPIVCEQIARVAWECSARITAQPLG